MQLYDINGGKLPCVGDRVEWYSRHFKGRVTGVIRKIVVTKYDVYFSTVRDKTDRLVEREVSRYNRELKRVVKETVQERIPYGISVLRNYKTLKVLS